MPVALRASIAVLALGPLAVHGLFEHITFSPIDQCGAFAVSFNGGVAPDALPLQLTIIPFNASPIAITLPDNAWDETTTTGAAITFLPFPAGATFLASLDDANGNPTGLNTSDIIQVQPSDNTTCLPTTTAQAPLYTIVQAPEQCQLFDVVFDNTTVNTQPTVRAFAPLAPSFFLDNKSFAPGNASYLMNVTRGTQVALLFDDGAGHTQTSSLLTVFGDTSSPSQCLNNGRSVSTATPIGGESTTNGGLSRVSIIVITISTVVIIGTLSLMSVIFVARERKRRKTARLRAAFFPRGDPEKINPYMQTQPTPPAPAYLADPRETRVLTGQPYSGAFSPRSGHFAQSSSGPLDPRTPKSATSGISETLYALPSPPPPPTLSRPPQRNGLGRHSSIASVSRRNIADLDIEHMLEQAAVSPGPASAFTPGITPGLPSSQVRPSASPVQIASPLPSALRISPVSSKRDAQELDVPSSATPSGRFSDYSHIVQVVSPSERYRVAPFLDPPPFSAGSRRKSSNSKPSR